MSQAIKKVFNYEIFTDKLIGKGSNGIVLECRHTTKQFSQELCVKIVKCSQDNSVDIETYKEIQILKEIKSVQNQNIITILDIFQNAGEYFIVMEYCRGGDLQQYIDKQNLKQQYFQASELLNFIYQFCKGYKTLVAHNILHRDIKPQNIFVNLKPLTFKIGDLGAGRILQNAGVKGNYTCVGTPLYCSPQIFNQQEYSNKADIYSLGMVLFQLCYLTLPFAHRDQIQEFNNQIKISNPIIKQNLPTPGNQQDQNEIKFLIENMIIFEEDQRLSWNDLFQRIENNQCYAQFKNQVNLNQSMSQTSQKKESDSRIFMSSCMNNIKFQNSEIKNNSQIVQETNKGPLRQVMRLFLAKYQLLDKFLGCFQDVIQKSYFQLKPIWYFSILCSTFGYQNSLIQQIDCIYTGEMKLMSQHITKYKEIFAQNQVCIEAFKTQKTQQDDIIYNGFKDHYLKTLKNRNVDQIIQYTKGLINKQKIKLKQVIGLQQLLLNKAIDCLLYSNLLTQFCEIFLQKKIEEILSSKAYGEISENFSQFIAFYYEILKLEQRIPQIEFYNEKKLQKFPILDWKKKRFGQQIVIIKKFILKLRKMKQKLKIKQLSIYQINLFQLFLQDFCFILLNNKIQNINRYSITLLYQCSFINPIDININNLYIYIYQDFFIQQIMIPSQQFNTMCSEHKNREIVGTCFDQECKSNRRNCHECLKNQKIKHSYIVDNGALEKTLEEICTVSSKLIYEYEQIVNDILTGLRQIEKMSLAKFCGMRIYLDRQKKELGLQ